MKRWLQVYLIVIFLSLSLGSVLSTNIFKLDYNLSQVNEFYSIILKCSLVFLLLLFLTAINRIPFKIRDTLHLASLLAFSLAIALMSTLPFYLDNQPSNSLMESVLINTIPLSLFILAHRRLTSFSFSILKLIRNNNFKEICVSSKKLSENNFRSEELRTLGKYNLAWSLFTDNKLREAQRVFNTIDKKLFPKKNLGAYYCLHFYFSFFDPDLRMERKIRLKRAKKIAKICKDDFSSLNFQIFESHLLLEEGHTIEAKEKFDHFMSEKENFLPNNHIKVKYISPILIEAFRNYMIGSWYVKQKEYQQAVPLLKCSKNSSVKNIYSDFAKQSLEEFSDVL